MAGLDVVDECVDWRGDGARAGRGLAAGAGHRAKRIGDAVDRDVARVRAATDKFKSSAAAEALGYVRVTDFPAWTATEPPGAFRSATFIPSEQA